MSNGTEFILLDPVGEPQVAKPQELSPRVQDLNGKALGLLFDGHYAAVYFWPALGVKLQERFKFASVVSDVKSLVGSVAPKQVLDNIAAKADMAVIGVGA